MNHYTFQDKKMEELIQLRDKQSIINVSNEITKDLDHFSIYELILKTLTDYQQIQISPILIETLIDKYIISINNSLDDLNILLNSIKELNFSINNSNNNNYNNIYYDLILFKISIIYFNKFDFNSCILNLNKINDLKFKDIFKLNYLELNLIYCLCFKVLKDSINFDKYILKSYKLLNSYEFSSSDGDNSNFDSDINRFKLIKFKIICIYSEYLVLKNKLSESIEIKFKLIQSNIVSDNLIYQWQHEHEHEHEYINYLIQLIKSFILNLYLCEFNSIFLKNMILFYKLYKSNKNLQKIILKNLNFKILLILKFIENKIIKLNEIEEIQNYFHDEYDHDHDIDDNDDNDNRYEEIIFNNLIKLNLILISKNFENIKFNQILNLINFENYSIIEELLIDLNNNKLISCKIDHIHEIVHFENNYDNNDDDNDDNNNWVTSILSNIDNLSNDI